MRISTGKDLYFNAQIWFARNIIPGLPNDDQAWARAFQNWLLEQGGRLIIGSKRADRNALGVDYLYDEIEFENEEDFLIFALKWS